MHRLVGGRCHGSAESAVPRFSLRQHAMGVSTRYIDTVQFSLNIESSGDVLEAPDSLTRMDSLLQLSCFSRTLLAWMLMWSAAACTWLARSARPGYPRLIATMPALLAMHCCPLLFDFRQEPLAAMSAAFICVRLTSGKVRWPKAVHAKHGRCSIVCRAVGS